LKEQQKEARYGRLHDNHRDPLPGPEKIVGERLALAQALAVLHQLPELDRVVFVLRVQHELPYVEIARVTGLSLSAAKVKVHRVRLKLAKRVTAPQQLEEVEVPLSSARHGTEGDQLPGIVRPVPSTTEPGAVSGLAPSSWPPDSNRL
jgi:hypothetical protein